MANASGSSTTSPSFARRCWPCCRSSATRARGFGDAEELYTALVEEGTSPDLLVLDQRLPDEFGSTILHSLRERPQYRDIPVIFVTAIDDEEASRLEVLAPVIRKPFDLTDFVAAASRRSWRPRPGEGRTVGLARPRGRYAGVEVPA